MVNESAVAHLHGRLRARAGGSTRYDVLSIALPLSCSGSSLEALEYLHLLLQLCHQELVLQEALLFVLLSEAELLDRKLLEKHPLKFSSKFV